MASRVLLISTNTYATPDPVFPLGMAQVASALRNEGHEVLWQDDLANPRPIEDLVRISKPDCVGVSIRNIDDVLIRKRETFFNKLPDLCRTIRREAVCPIVLGGSGFSVFPTELLQRSGADYGIRGEGESAFNALLKSFATKSDPSSIPGLVHRVADGVVCNPASGAPHPVPLDSTLGGVAGYYVQNGGGMLNVQTQRGCAHRCCYCTYPLIEGRHHRRRSGEEVAEDFARAVQAGAKYMFIVDSIFNSSLSHVHEVCEALIRKNLKVPWGCFLRPQGLNAEVMSLMVRAGLNHIEFGSDSFSDAVLAESHKGLTFGDVLLSSELARKENIDYCHFLICGGPGETRSTLKEGFERSRQLQGAVIMSVVGMRIYPGTPLFQRALDEGRICPDQNLLEPAYYIASGLSADDVFSELQAFASAAPNWIVGDVKPAYAQMVGRLRSRGVAGPLWSYLSMIQRLMPDRMTAGKETR